MFISLILVGGTDRKTWLIAYDNSLAIMWIQVLLRITGVAALIFYTYTISNWFPLLCKPTDVLTYNLVADSAASGTNNVPDRKVFD
jgi:hypothetical protein